VADSILNAETATFDTVLGGGPIVKNIVGNQYRKQILENGVEVIADYDTGHVLILNSVKKTAYFTELGNMTNYSTNYFQYLRDKIKILQLSPNTKVVDLGTRNINDRAANGLHIYNDSIDLKIWTDAKDNLPALISYDKTLGQSTLEMSNFKFNVPIEELALSMDVPEEYKLESLASYSAITTEDDLIEALNIWANIYLDGHFPDKLDGGLLITQAEKFNQKNEELGMTEKEKLTTALKITKGLLFIQNLPPDSDWQYTGKGVTTNDTKCIIFRYKPKASTTYRVIYGDLAVEDSN
jgi:outer membrane lipoprotein-sorting protein